MVKVSDQVLVNRNSLQHLTTRAKQGGSGRIHPKIIVHDPEGKELVLCVGGEPDGSNTTPADFLPKPVTAKLFVFLNSDIYFSGFRGYDALAKPRLSDKL